MATADLKNLEKLVNEVLENIKGLGAKKAPKNYDKTLKSISTKLDNIEEKLPLNIEGDGSSPEIVDKIEQITENLKRQTEDFIKEIQFAFENYQNNNELLNPQDAQISENIKDFVSIVTNEITDLKKQFEKFNTDFTEININTSMTVSKEILSMKNSVLALNDTIDSIKEKIESFNLKDELSPLISQDVTNSVTEALTAYLNNFKTEVFNLLAKVSDGITSIIDKQKILEGIELSIGEIRDGQYKNKDDIIKIISSNIAEENKKLLPQILQIVNSISFDDAAEEIKDGLYAVNENLGIVNKNIETGAQASSQILEQVSTMSKEINDISSSLPKAEVFSKLDETVQDISKAEIINKVLKIDAVLDAISAEFNMLTKGSKVGTGDYNYTLLDLESDISKVRIILDELNTSVKDDKNLSESVAAFVEKTSKLYSDPDYKAILEQFDTLNDDITSISKRTNKLILTSDDAAVKLEKNIQDFQNLMVNINNTVQRFENSNVLKSLLERTGNIHKVVKNSLQSSNAINEAFVYLASWIDNTSEEIKDIKNEIAEIKDIVVKNNETPKDDFSSKALQEFSKIEKLIKETGKKEDNSDIKDIKESINSLANQIQTLNETVSANKSMNKKIEKMEKQIQQLLTFVEEE